MSEAVRNAVLASNVPPLIREVLSFAGIALLVLGGYLLEQGGAATVFGGYAFALAIVGIARPLLLLNAFLFFVAMGHRDFTYTALKVGPANIYITEWVLAILLVAALPRLKTVWNNHRMASLLWSGYFAAGLFLFFFSYRYWPFGAAVRDFAIVYYSLFLVATLAHVRDSGHIRQLIMAILAGSTLNLTADCLNYLYGTYPETPEQKNHSMRSTFYYVVGAGFFMPMLLINGIKLSRTMIVYFTAVFAVVLLYAYSKTPMLVIFMVFLGAVVLLNWRLHPEAVCSVVLLFLLALLFTPQGKTFQFSNIFDPSTYLLDSRSMLEHGAMRDFAEYPYGIGFGAPIFGQRSMELLGNTNELHAIHNSYLTILRRTGIEGFALFAALIGYAVYAFQKGLRQVTGDHERTSLLGVFFGFAAAAIFATAHVALEGPFFGSVFWVLLGGVFVAARVCVPPVKAS